MAVKKSTNLFDVVETMPTTSLGGSMFEYGESSSLDKKEARPISDNTKEEKTNAAIIQHDHNMVDPDVLVKYVDLSIIDNNIRREPSTNIYDKFVDIPYEKTSSSKTSVFISAEPYKELTVNENAPTIDIRQFKEEQVSELPVHIIMSGKTYKIKDIEVDDWVKSIKDVIIKYQKMNMLLLYLATSTYNSRLIDVEYYIKTNNLESILIEV